MKKFLFIISAGMSIFLIANILYVVAFKMVDANEFQLGYLTGKLILLLLFGLLAFFTRKRNRV